MVSTSGSGREADSDEDALRYEQMVDQYMDDAYQAYLERHHARDANRVERHKRKRLDGDGDSDGAPAPAVAYVTGRTRLRFNSQLPWGAGDDAAAGESNLEGLPMREEAGGSDSASEEDGGGLLLSLDPAQAGVRSSGKALAQQWFAQDAFQVCTCFAAHPHCHPAACPCSWSVTATGRRRAG